MPFPAKRRRARSTSSGGSGVRVPCELQPSCSKYSATAKTSTPNWRANSCNVRPVLVSFMNIPPREIGNSAAGRLSRLSGGDKTAQFLFKSEGYLRSNRVLQCSLQPLSAQCPFQTVGIRADVRAPPRSPAGGVNCHFTRGRANDSHQLPLRPHRLAPYAGTLRDVFHALIPLLLPAGGSRFFLSLVALFAGRLGLPDIQAGKVQALFLQQSGQRCRQRFVQIAHRSANRRT